MNGMMTWIDRLKLTFWLEKLYVNFGKFNFLSEDGREVQKFSDKENS